MERKPRESLEVTGQYDGPCGPEDNLNLGVYSVNSNI